MGAAQTASDDSASPGLPGSLPELLSWRRAQPDGEFLVTDEERLSFAEADAQSRTLADALLASGLGVRSFIGLAVALVEDYGLGIALAWMTVAIAQRH